MGYSNALVAAYNHALDAVEAIETVDFSNVPRLDDYTPILWKRARIFLIGEVEGHPHLGTRSISTSDLVWIDDVRGVARTVSRFYKLGARDPVESGYIVTGGALTGVSLSDMDEVKALLASKAVEFRALKRSA